MIGAIIGDIVGSPYEGGYKKSVKDIYFPLFSEDSRFTDDTVLTCATAYALIHPAIAPYKSRFARQYKKWAISYPDRGYGGRFKEWIAKKKLAVMNSYANGCMMRCSPIALFYQDKEIMFKRALQSIAYTHNSPESERGILAIVDAMHMAMDGVPKSLIKDHIQINYGHMLNMTLSELKNKVAKNPRDIRCNLTAPQALQCFMLGNDYETTIRYAVYSGGDTDTIATIAGGLAEAYYGVNSIPQFMINKMKEKIDDNILSLINDFYKKIGKYNKKYEGYKL